MRAAHSSTRPQEAADALNVHAESVGDWAEERGPHISAAKSFVTLFTSDTHQSLLHSIFTLKNSTLPLKRHLKLLGVTFDTHFFFNQRVLTVKKKAAERLKFLKALAGTNWGQQK